MTPLRQGDLDGLCGVYAVLNAVQYLIPPARDQDYLNKLMVHIIGTCYTAKDVTGGGDELKMNSVFEYARDKISKDFKINAIMSNQGRGQFQTPDAAMDAAFYLAKGVFIMGYEGRDSHWTVVRGIKGSQVLLFDSCEQKRFLRKDLIWSKDAVSPEDDKKIIVDPGDLNWVICGGIS